MLRTVLKWIAIAPLVAMACYFGFRELAPDRWQIRWMVEDMLEGFSEASLRPVLSGVAADFVDTASGARRDDLREALTFSFFQDVDPTTGEYLYRAELDRESLSIALDDDGAEVALEARFFKRRATGDELFWDLFWDARITGRVAEIDGDWQWTRTTSVNHSDRPRMR